MNYKIIGAHKKFKNLPCPLVRPSSVNFCLNFWNLSHETVPLSWAFTMQHSKTWTSASYGNLHTMSKNCTWKWIFLRLSACSIIHEKYQNRGGKIHSSFIEVKKGEETLERLKRLGLVCAFLYKKVNIKQIIISLLVIKTRFLNAEKIGLIVIFTFFADMLILMQ